MWFWGCYCRVINKTKVDLENGLGRARLGKKQVTSRVGRSNCGLG